MNSDFVPVKTFSIRPEAERAQQFLAAEGITALISGDDASGWAPHIGWAGGGITLSVARADLDSAEELLNEVE